MSQEREHVMVLSGPAPTRLFTVDELPSVATLRTMFAYFAAAGCRAETMIDLGGNDGKVIEPVMKTRNVTILDSDPKHREAALANGAKEYVVAAIADAPAVLAGRKFDAAFLMEVMEHAANEAGAVEMLKTALSLAPYVIITTPFERDWSPRLDPFTNPDHRIYWTDATFAAALSASGARVCYADRMRWCGWSYFFALVAAPGAPPVALLPGLVPEVR